MNYKFIVLFYAERIKGKRQHELFCLNYNDDFT